MDWPVFVEQNFYKYLKESDTDPNLIASLKTSPRTKPFLDKLAQEISKAERLVHKRRGKKLKIETIRDTVYDFTKILLKGIEHEASVRAESEIARHARESKAQYQKDLEETAKGNVSGVFEDMGLKVDDTVVEEAQDGQKENGSAQ